MTDGTPDPVGPAASAPADPYDLIADAFPDLDRRQVEVVAVCVDTFRNHNRGRRPNLHLVAG